MVLSARRTATPVETQRSMLDAIGETELEIAPVEDDELLEQLVDILQQIIDEEMNGSDEDEEDESESDDEEDDSIWDEFIHKKLN